MSHHAEVRAGAGESLEMSDRGRCLDRGIQVDHNSSVNLVEPILAVDVVTWARAQMAFTLAFHIILVPLGVSWAAMTLIANYRGLKHGDKNALRLAQRWSKYMAVTFAVGAVTGTVLSFEFGLLWPAFMDQWGDASGFPSPSRGFSSSPRLSSLPFTSLVGVG